MDVRTAGIRSGQMPGTSRLELAAHHVECDFHCKARFEASLLVDLNFRVANSSSELRKCTPVLGMSRLHGRKKEREPKRVQLRAQLCHSIVSSEEAFLRSNTFKTISLLFRISIK